MYVYVRTSNTIDQIIYFYTEGIRIWIKYLVRFYYYIVHANPNIKELNLFYLFIL